MKATRPADPLSWRPAAISYTGPMDIGRLRDNYRAVLDRIAAAASRAGRDPAGVTLVAVTKTNPAAMIRPLVNLGARDLGENYPQELWRKAEELADLPARWHLIGHLQGKKVKATVPLVRMVHGVNTLKLLRALDVLAAEIPDPPAVCLQVNASGEASKHGWAPRRSSRTQSPSPRAAQSPWSA